MERLQIIRETINYAHQFYGLRFVVKIDNQALTYVLERGIHGDIDKIRQTGIEVIVTHFSDEVAANIAVEQKAQKLIFVTNARGVFCPPDTLLRQLNVRDARELLAKPRAVNGTMRDKLEASIKACNCGINRVHIISGEEGNLLLEIFTCDGVGTMISKMPHERVRKAETGDINDIMEILRETISKSCFDSALITKSISNFWVFSVDGNIHGCMQLMKHSDCNMIEVSCPAVTLKYENLDIMERLLKHAIEYAGAKKCKGVFLIIKENTLYLPLYPWFTKLGFKRDIASQIPRIYKNAGTDCWVCPAQENI